MAFYNYRCDVCKIKDVTDKKSLSYEFKTEAQKDRYFELLENKKFYIYETDEPEECDLVWEERHSIHETPEIKCPLCEEVAQKTMIGVKTIFYTRGDGYLDRAGARRDMDLYKLTKDDPYKGMRQSGEAEDLAQRLRNAGKKGYDEHGRKTTQYFSPLNQQNKKR